MNTVGINKTIVVSVAIFSIVFAFVGYHYADCIKQKALTEEKLALIEKERAVALKTETRDRFTVCIDTVMSKSIQAGKPIDAEKAKDICAQVKEY